MVDACCDATDSVVRDTETIAIGTAAEIRAAADAIPEEFYGANGVRAWLLEEADRAERGLPDPQDEGPGFAADCASFLNKVA